MEQNCHTKLTSVLPIRVKARVRHISVTKSSSQTVNSMVFHKFSRWEENLGSIIKCAFLILCKIALLMLDLLTQI